MVLIFRTPVPPPNGLSLVQHDCAALFRRALSSSASICRNWKTGINKIGGWYIGFLLIAGVGSFLMAERLDREGRRVDVDDGIELGQNVL